MEEQCLSRYIDVSEQELATRRENILNDWSGKDNKQLKHRLRQECEEKWMTEPLHGQCLRQTQQIADCKSWAWLTTGGLKKETEGFLIVEQDQALRTNAIKVKIDKQEGDNNTWTISNMS